MQFQSDEPIKEWENPYTEIAEVIANLASSPPEERSIVIGIAGPWGSGKSALIQLVFQEARKRDIPDNHMILFDSWRLGQGVDVQRMFFNEMASGLGIVVDRETIKTLERYASRLARAGENAERLLNVVSRITTVLGLVGIGSIAMVKSQLAQILVLAGSIAIYTMGPMLLGTAWVMRLTARLLKRKPRFGDSTEVLKKRIDKKLIAIKKPILVAIDNIDRIPFETVNNILMVIMESAHFSNLTYILAYDIGFMTAALETATGDSGRMALEKIVNIQVEIPEINLDDLNIT